MPAIPWSTTKLSNNCSTKIKCKVFIGTYCISSWLAECDEWSKNARCLTAISSSALIAFGFWLVIGTGFMFFHLLGSFFACVFVHLVLGTHLHVCLLDWCFCCRKSWFVSGCVCLLTVRVLVFLYASLLGGNSTFFNDCMTVQKCASLFGILIMLLTWKGVAYVAGIQMTLNDKWNTVCQPLLYI